MCYNLINGGISMEGEYGIVRLQEITIKNFKNVKNGTVCFQSYKNIKKENNINNSDILGIYGQNGSGKTALVESLDILKSLLSGEEINKDMVKLLSCDEEESEFKYIFKIILNNRKYLVKYSYVLKVVEEDKKSYVQVIKEELKYSELEEEKNISWKSIINYNINNRKDSLFKPMEVYKEIIHNDENIMDKLFLASELAKISGNSFIFGDRSIKIFYDSFKKNNLYLNIIENLRQFAIVDLFIITNNYLGHINLQTLMPFSFMLEEKSKMAFGTVTVALFDASIIEEDMYELLEKISEQINIVLRSIIPGLTIEIKILKETLTEKGEIGKNIELLSVRDNIKIPLKYESEGIKKIISILSALIAMYNNEKVCLVVDELDAGIFEFLLGELLKILKDNAKGQLIFTSHNLRPLEVLSKNDVMFTTVNKENRYIRLKNVKTSNNLRDFYLRGIFLGGQKETIYEKTKSYEINRAFRKAGKTNVK